MSPVEKRRTPRIRPYVAPCRIVDGERRVRAYMADLSPAGVQVSCDMTPPSVGSFVVVEVRFGSQVRYSRLPAEVKWVRPRSAPGSPHVLGLTFAGVTAEEQGVLESVLEEFRRRAAQLA